MIAVGPEQKKEGKTNTKQNSSHVNATRHHTTIGKMVVAISALSPKKRVLLCLNNFLFLFFSALCLLSYTHTHSLSLKSYLLFAAYRRRERGCTFFFFVLQFVIPPHFTCWLVECLCLFFFFAVMLACARAQFSFLLLFLPLKRFLFFFSLSSKESKQITIC